MQDRHLLIADPSEDFTLAVSQALDGQFQIHVCHSGTEALEQLRLFRPNLLLLDLVLPQMDGLTLLQTAKREGILPPIVVASSLNNPYISGLLQQLGVIYIFLKPCSIPSVAERLLELRSYDIPAPTQGVDPQEQIGQLLLTLSVPPKLHGFGYLRSSVLYMAQAPGTQVTKVLYPAVGAEFGTSAMLVERSIRNAIVIAWKHRDEQIWQQFFPRTSEGTVKRPTNSEFISRLADVLHLP